MCDIEHVLIEEGLKAESIGEEGVMIVIEFGGSPKYQCNGETYMEVHFHFLYYN